MSEIENAWQTGYNEGIRRSLTFEALTDQLAAMTAERDAEKLRADDLAATVETLNRLRVHCERCGADYLATGVEAGCPCQLAAITAERDNLAARLELARKTVNLAAVVAEGNEAERNDLAAKLENVRTGLRQHFLAQIVCNHDTGQDNPICACSMVFLGWHPSVGEAVEAWIDHALAAIAGKDAAK